MATFAENFTVEITKKPAPVSTDEALNDPETVYLGGVETIAERCNMQDYDEDQDNTPVSEGSGTWYFTDGSKAGLRIVDGKWDAWVMKALVDA